MVFGLFTKHCAVCGKDVDKNEAIKKFGQYLCSKEHAEEYSQTVEKAKAKRGGGCCG